MKIVITLAEVLSKCDDWEKYCNERGYDTWIAADGGGDIEDTLTEEEAFEYGLFNDYR